MPSSGRNKTFSLHIYNDVLQEVRVTLDLSKVPLLPQNPSTSHCGGQLMYFHFILNIWEGLSVYRNLELGIHLQVGALRFHIPDFFFLSFNSSPQKNAVHFQSASHCFHRSNSSVLTPFYLFFLTQGLPRKRRLEPALDLYLFLVSSTFRMETYQYFKLTY